MNNNYVHITSIQMTTINAYRYVGVVRTSLLLSNVRTVIRTR